MSGKGRGGSAPRVVRNNHLIQCYIYKNVALFKGDTYVYRGLFKRNGGNFNKEHYGYVIPIDNNKQVSDEISRMVSGFIIYRKGDEKLDVETPTSQNLLLDDTLDLKSSNVRFYEDPDANCANNTSDNMII
jgi:hypothetical protein